jgi:hypothetical protein
MYKIFAFCRRLDKDREGHPLPVNLSRLIVNAQKRFSIDRNQVGSCVASACTSVVSFFFNHMSPFVALVWCHLLRYFSERRASQENTLSQGESGRGVGRLWG